ncbi:MAG: SDR family oxidoreductase [Planctomycetota bacterium]|nr:SDR family oxidoreductase [Planctomycetota bacterium]
MSPVDSNQKPLRVLVVGATGGTGRATVEALLSAGHIVTAFSRRASKLCATMNSSRLSIFDGDVMKLRDVEEASKDQDVAIVTLGIQENPLKVRLFGSTRTPMNVRSEGTRNVIEALRKHGSGRVIVQSSYGVGESRDQLGLIDRLFFTLLLKPQIADTEIQESIVKSSDIDWVLVQPVHLTDSEEMNPPFESTRGQTRRMSVARKRVARFLTESIQRNDLNRSTVALSG